MLEAGAEPVLGFRLRMRLGAGAFAEVWDATTPAGSHVAMKFIDSRSKDAALLRAEIRILQALTNARHPNLIQLLGVYASSHYMVLCMERAEGNLQELREVYWESTGQHIPVDHLLEILEQAASGLDFLSGLRLPGFNQSSSGMQHCDVKPSNLLLLGETVKVADFGLCAGEGQRTHKKGWRGTPPYAAPELNRGRPSPTTDQFGLAVTYCDLLAGDKFFFPAETWGRGSTISVNLSKVPERQRPVLERALAMDPT
ncbi:MAG: protein kinase domain-containing protein, partial [Candidatus Acidiferrum sp.]